MPKPADPPIDPPVNPPIDSPADPPVDPPADPLKVGLLDRPPIEPDPDPDVPVRPDNIPDNFWNKDEGTVRVDELISSYDSIRKEYNRLKNDDSGIPEKAEEYLEGMFDDQDNYIFLDKMKNIETFSKDDLFLKAYTESALEQGLTKKQSDGFLQTMLLAMDDFHGETDGYDEEVEMAKLGPRAKERVDGVEVYLEGMNFSKEELEAVRGMAFDAVGIQVIEKLMHEAGQLSIPLGTAADATTHGEMKAEWEKLLENPEALDNDPIKRARFEALGEKLHPDSSES